MTIVAWPPPTPPNTRVNATAQLDNHPSDHNKIADALDTIIARFTPIAHVERTTPLTITATTWATSQEFVTAGPLTFDGGPVIIEFSSPIAISPGQVGQSLYIGLADGTTTDLGIIAALTNNAAAGAFPAPIFGRRRLTPAAGSHTYNVRAWMTSGSGASIQGGTGGAGAMAPAILRIVRA